MNRAGRDEFISGLAHGKTSLPGMIYSVAPSRLGERLNMVTIVFALDWPSESGQPVDTSELRKSTKLQAVTSEIFRVKDFLERQLLTEVRLFDVRRGCIRVRFSIEGEVDLELVGTALRSLLRKKEYYSVSVAYGNVGGRAVSV